MHLLHKLELEILFVGQPYSKIPPSVLVYRWILRRIIKVKNSWMLYGDRNVYYWKEKFKFYIEKSFRNRKNKYVYIYLQTYRIGIKFNSQNVFNFLFKKNIFIAILRKDIGTQFIIYIYILLIFFGKAKSNQG